MTSRMPPVHIALLVILLIAGCELTAPPKAAFDGTWAQQTWRGDAEALFMGDTLHIIGSSPAGGQLVETLVKLAIPYNGPGTYHLAAGGARVDYLTGGDVLSAVYTTVTSGAATVIIDDVTSERIRGTVGFDAVATYGERPVGASALFEGRFSARVLR